MTKKIMLVISFKYCGSQLDFGPIFELVAKAYWKGLEVKFQCLDWHPEAAEVMSRVVEQESSWRESILQVQQITCCKKHSGVASPTVQLRGRMFASKQDRDEREKLVNVWSSLGSR